MNLAIQKKQNISFSMGLILLLLFAAALNLITRYYFFVFIAFFLFALKPKRKFKLDLATGLLLVLALAWMAFSPISTISVLGIFKPYTFVLCYIMGVGFFDDGVDNNSEKSPYRLFYWIIVILALGTFAHYCLNWYTNPNFIGRNTIDIWTKEPMAATGQAALACLPLGISIACLFSKTNKKIKMISTATILLVLGYNLVLAGRTLLVMFLIVMAVSFLHRLSTLKKGKLRLIIIVLAVIFLLLFIYQTNIFNIRSYIESTPIYDRFFAENNEMDLDEDGRIRKKIYHLSNMNRFLFGGAHIREEIGYSHDIIFDTYDEAGIFALIAMIGYLAVSFSHLIKCVKDRTLPFVFRNIILCVYSIVYLEFMVEPILQGMPWLFASFCLIDGYVGRILSYNRKLGPKERCIYESSPN